jgi:hypothetical protein
MERLPYPDTLLSILSGGRRVEEYGKPEMAAGQAEKK